jgi:hypothetical protein
MPRSLAFLLALTSACAPATPSPEPASLVGRTGRPLGTPVDLQGVAVGSRSKGLEGRPLLRVQRIDGVATQEDLVLPLDPFPLSDALETFERGTSYAIRGYESGRMLGVPEWAYRESGARFATQGFHFATESVVVACRPIAPIAFGPADFLDRRAILEGDARTIDGRAWIAGSGWRIQAPGPATWPSWMDGKPVEADGLVRRGPGEHFHLDDGRVRLIRLEDQVGRPVELRGTAWSRNGDWWLSYRGVELSVENMDALPGWHAELHGTTVVILGVLERDPKNAYIVRRASWRTP